MTRTHFTHETLDFLAALAANNNRDWFEEHKQNYEDAVRTPALDFIEEMAGELPAISSHFLALPRKSGGSLMRVHRDIRFGNIKTPYKTNIGIHFRHEVGKDVHAPGYYLHVEPGNCFLGVGIWRPDATALGKIRDGIVTKGESWLAARDNKKFKSRFTLDGDTLVNPPRGYPKEHAFLVDLKRKDFIAVTQLNESALKSKKFVETVLEQFTHATPFMRFLCNALELPF